MIGALAVLGLKFSRAKEDETEDPAMWAFTRELLHRSRNDIMGGSINCRDFAKVDWTNIAEVKAFYASDRLLECRRITGETARMLGELLKRNR